MSEKKSILNVVIDATGARVGADAVIAAHKRMSSAANKNIESMKSMTSNSFNSMSKVMSSTTATSSKMWTSMRSLASKTLSAISKSFSAMTSTIVKSYEKIKEKGAQVFESLGKSTSFVSSIKAKTSAILGALTGGGIVAGLKELVTTGLRMQKFRTTLTVITGTAKEANKELSWLMTLANRVGILFEAAAEPFARFAAASAETFSSTQIRGIFSAFSEAAAALHLNVQEINGVFLALQQMVSKGKVSMEELRLQLAERIPGAMQVAAESMQMSVGELEDAIRRRAVSAKEFMVGFGQGISEKFGGAAQLAAETAIGAFANLKNELFAAKVEIAEAGLLTALGDGATRLAHFLKSNVSTIRQIGIVLEDVVRDSVDWLTDLTAEDVNGAFVAVRNVLGTIHTMFVRLADSKFFKWLTKPRTKMEINQDLVKEAKNLESLNKELARHKVWVDSSEQIDALNARIAKSIDRTKELKQELADLDAPKLPLLTTKTASEGRNAGRTSYSATDAELEEQIRIVMHNAERMGRADYELTLLMERRADLIADSARYLDKATGDASAELDLKQRLQAAIKYKSTILELKEVNESLSKFDSAQIKSEKSVSKYGDDYDKVRFKLQELKRAADEGLEIPGGFEEAQERILSTLDERIGKLTKINALIDSGKQSPEDELTRFKPMENDNTFLEADAFSGAMDAVGSLAKNESIYAQQEKLLRDHYDRKRELVVGTEAEMAEQIAKINAEQTRTTERMREDADKNRLAGASQMFGNLSALMNSENKKMAAIGKAAAIANTTIATYESATKAYNSLVGVPIAGPALATAAAAAAVIAGMANVRAIMSTPVAHGGLDYVPKESTYLLDKGERVLSPRQNSDLTSFLKGSGKSSQSITIVNNGAPVRVVSDRVLSDSEREIIIAEAVEAAENRVAGGIVKGDSSTSEALESVFRLDRSAGSRR